ncbi:MAG: oxidoreductase [Treponema sp. GWB1_62_6]|nr:MAG: oxidoreductase [Treponema sp. GWB1_62_6]OHE64698.1 MAG: oxidoreductase [Treponema sp. GWC1_61_84]OHE75608.1 MAG: oxidoreductase [Treponema sp. RIFOXYC1_FULL_61_9]HCM27530.1 oxidoreductase [Treponema sp.]
MQKSDGMNYAPQGKPLPVCEIGEFVFSAVSLDHGHIYGMCNGLREAGGKLKSVWDPDPKKVEVFQKTYPDVMAASSEEEVLADREVRLVAGAAVTSRRGALGLRVMDAGKDYFTDKAPFTTLEQLEAARGKVKATGKKYMVYYSERLHVEGAVYAGQLIESGAIGKVIQVIGLGPHRLSAASRPAWFFEREKYGGVLCDIGSHQIEQYLHYSAAKDATVVRSQIANYNHPEHPELEDFGDAMLVGDNGTTNYFRVDWFTPDGLGTWGDGRTVVLGTEGYIEIRKYIDLARSKSGDNVYLADNKGEHLFNVSGKIGFPFFGKLILDCLNRTETAMTQEHAFKAAELCLKAQTQAARLC